MAMYKENKAAQGQALPKVRSGFPLCRLISTGLSPLEPAGLVTPSAGEAAKRVVCPHLWADQPLCSTVNL